MAGCLAAAFSYGLFASFGVFFKAIQEEFGWNRTVTSSLQTLSTGVFIFSTLLIGWLTDRYGPRLGLVLGAVFVGAGFTLFSRSQSLLQSYAFYALASLGVGVIWSLPTATVQRWFVKGRGLVLAITTAGVGLGMFVYPLAASSLLEVMGWRDSYVIMGLGTALLLLVAATVVVQEPSKKGLRAYGAKEQVGTVEGVATEGWVVGQALRTGAFQLLALAVMIEMVPTFLIFTHVVPFATDLGINERAAAGALGMIGLVSIVGRIIAGVMAEKLGFKWAAIVSGAGAAAVLLWLPSTKSLGTLYVFAIIFGLFHGGRAVSTPGLVASLFGTKNLAQLIGAIHALSLIGGLLGPVLGGLVFDWTNSYSLAFFVGATAFGLGTLLIWFVKEPRPYTRR